MTTLMLLIEWIGMKCAKHPRSHAVGVCISCGEGVCRNCEIRVQGRTHCKPCVEKGRIPHPTPTYTAPAAQPKGKPTRKYFIIGAVGTIILIVGATLFWTIPFVSMYISFFYNPYLMGYLYLAVTIIIGVGGTLGSIGIYGHRWNYGSVLSVVTCVLSMIFTWFLLPTAILSFVFMGLPYYYYYHSPLLLVMDILGSLGYILMGVMFILWGVAMINARNHMGNAGLGVATGILYIITGGFWCATMGASYIFYSVYLYYVACILVIPSGILGIITLLRARVPH